MNFTESTQIRLPPGTLSKLQKIAEREGIKHAEIVRLAIKRIIDEKEEAALNSTGDNL